MNVKGMYDGDRLEEAVQVTKDMMPENGTVLCLSLCGSRAFGWGNGYDYDVHGIFHAEDFWGWCHSGQRYDLNMYNMIGKVQREVNRQHFSFFMNMSNPFYLDDRLHYDDMMDLMSNQMLGGKVEWEVTRFENQKNPRSALHTYRVCMQCLNYLETGIIEIDARELAEKYGYDYFFEVADIYMGKCSGFDYDKAEHDLYELKKEFLSKNYEKNKDDGKIQEWIDGVINEF